MANADDCDDGDAWSYPGAAELDDGLDNDCDGWTDEGIACPCFDYDDLDATFAGWNLYSHYWNKRPGGITNELSVRGWDSYYYDGTQWRSPTIGADIYRVTAEGGAAYCENWSADWLAQDKTWGDYEADAYAIADEDYEVCDDLLRDWAADNGVSITHWL